MIKFYTTLALVCVTVVTVTSANAASILFGRVGSTSYFADGVSGDLKV